VGLVAERHAWFGAAAVGLVVAVLGYVVLPTVSGLVAACALSVVLAVSTVAEVAEPTPLSVGAALVVVGALICLLSAFGPVRHRDFGVGLGAVVALIGAQQPLAEASAIGWAYALTVAVGIACFVLYRYLPAVMLLVVGLLGIAVAVLEATWDVSSGPVAIAVTLAATGATLIGMGAVGMRLWRVSGEPGLHRSLDASAASIAAPVGGPPNANRRPLVLDGTIVEDDWDRVMVPRGRRRS
jgi:hypothetical protein